MLVGYNFIRLRMQMGAQRGGHIIERRSREDGIKVLGCIVSCSGSMDTETDARISAGWGAFYANKESLTCFAVPLKRRLMLLRSVVEPAVFWCAGTWKLTAEHCANLRGMQRTMIRKMIRCRRTVDEHEDVYHPRVQRSITNLMIKHATLSWDLRARDFYFKWAGQVIRLGKTDPNRLTPMVLNFRNIQSIRRYADAHGGNQGHGRCLHVWRWESDISDYGEHHRTDWELLAMNITDWFNLHLEEFRCAKAVRDNLLVRGHKRCRRGAG